MIKIARSILCAFSACLLGCGTGSGQTSFASAAKPQALIVTTTAALYNGLFAAPLVTKEAFFEHMGQLTPSAWDAHAAKLSQLAFVIDGKRVQLAYEDLKAPVAASDAATRPLAESWPGWDARAFVATSEATFTSMLSENVLHDDSTAESDEGTGSLSLTADEDLLNPNLLGALEARTDAYFTTSPNPSQQHFTIDGLPDGYAISYDLVARRGVATIRLLLYRGGKLLQVIDDPDTRAALLRAIGNGRTGATAAAAAAAARRSRMTATAVTGAALLFAAAANPFG